MPYNPTFISGVRIPLPDVTICQVSPASPLHYHHHSIVMNPERRLAYFSASNIDGRSWQPIERKGGFKKDIKIEAAFQLGEELYDLIAGGNGKKNDFDEGHLTSFQEVLWGEESESQLAGADTFFYTNCVPQHRSLNRGAWRSLEQYMIKKGADPNELKITVMTGPVLHNKDPFFIHIVDGDFVRVPCAFWKVIYYKTVNGLQAVGFMMSHRNLLLEDETITFRKGDVSDRGEEETEDAFMMFPRATTYQVSIDFIEKMTGIKFFNQEVCFPFQQQGSRELILKRIEVAIPRGMDPGTFIEMPVDYELGNIII